MASTAHETAARPLGSQQVVERSSRRFRFDAGKEWILFILFMLPNIVLFSLFTFWPMIENVRLSTQRWDMISPVRRSVGSANYRYLLENGTFHKVLLNTLYFTVAAVGLSLVIGLAVALLLNQPLKFRDGARAVVFAPTLLSGAAIGIVWSYIFDPRYGLMAQVLGWANLSSPDWLNRPEWSMPAIIIVYVWKNMGFAAVIFLAGLQAIPRDLYDAARVDGANVWWRFRSVTLPMLSPITFFLLITSILNTFQAFDIIRVMTQGGPVDSTNTLIYYIYEQGFVALNAGRSAAAALVLFALMMIITLVQLRFTERRVHYG
ncbi:MAG: Glycerol-3-phosphate ABC transporter, permease protein UgpA [uncultured Thermomicrobiales bacterium]|uniref:Glycerol-3-phosphate ABC transporter, permease protein UgpA n=1 Tax=uncultured Thermomicrobiales bacterium TaxID=1645740 RepID=A0A6J4V3G3_9BACT|nr:MAG: Glycerol-3-phosphate ABC transporter, permease protein UgpA [uncultured Thermomicrobiales bacterium]